VALEERREALLAQTAGIEGGGIALQKGERDLRVHARRNVGRRSSKSGLCTGKPKEALSRHPPTSTA
jgi:hypothetical protein